MFSLEHSLTTSLLCQTAKMDKEGGAINFLGSRIFIIMIGPTALGDAITHLFLVAIKIPVAVSGSTFNIGLEKERKTSASIRGVLAHIVQVVIHVVHIILIPMGIVSPKAINSSLVFFENLLFEEKEGLNSTQNELSQTESETNTETTRETGTGSEEVISGTQGPEETLPPQNPVKANFKEYLREIENKVKRVKNSDLPAVINRLWNLLRLVNEEIEDNIAFEEYPISFDFSNLAHDEKNNWNIFQKYVDDFKGNEEARLALAGILQEYIKELKDTAKRIHPKKGDNNINHNSDIEAEIKKKELKNKKEEWLRDMPSKENLINQLNEGRKRNELYLAISNEAEIKKNFVFDDIRHLQGVLDGFFNFLEKIELANSLDELKQLKESPEFDFWSNYFINKLPDGIDRHSRY